MSTVHTDKIIIRGYDLPESLEDLINLRVSREQRLPRTHLGEDTSHRPHVDASGVLSTAKQDLGGTVPERNDLVGVGSKRNTEGTRQTKIGKLQVSVAIDQQVLRLQIAMQDSMAVTVTDSFA